MKNKKVISLLILLSVSFTACKDKDEDEPELVSGTGGELTIVAKPQHHGDPILNQLGYMDSAFVKFNTQNFPGADPLLYDAIFVGEDVGEDHVHLDSIKPGKMFIFMTGWDTTINQRVFGGIPINTSQKTGELDVVVPVVE